MKRIGRDSSDVPLYEVLESSGKVDSAEIAEAVQEKIVLALKPLETSVESVFTTLPTIREDLSKEFGNFKSEVRLLLQESSSQKDFDFSEASEDCIEDAFVFMRTLNEIESLMTDSDFTGGGEKNKGSNNATLATYKNPDHALYKNCIEILNRKYRAGQITEVERAELAAQFDELFEAVDGDLKSRAQRLAIIHRLRDRILSSFAEGCSDEPTENPSDTKPSVTSSVARVKSDVPAKDDAAKADVANPRKGFAPPNSQ